MAIEQASAAHDATTPASGGVSAVQAASFLAARFGPEIDQITKVGQGEWSTAYGFRRDGAEYVIRFGAYFEDFAKDRLAAGFSSKDLPIPAITDTGEAFGGFYAISERAYGGTLDELDAEQLRTVLPSLFAALNAARQADVSATTGYGGWDGNGTAPYPSWREALLDVAIDRPTQRTHGWRERLVASPTGPGPFDEALGYFQTLVDNCPEERHLIHADLLNRNVLVADGRLTAVLDWGCAQYGDFLYDLAWLLFWQPWYPAWRDVDFQGAAERHNQQIGLEVPHLEERLRCYQVHIGLDAQAYNAFKGQERWAALEATARRTLAMAKSSR
jgi:hygromycin-B 4-O-kinase